MLRKLMAILFLAQLPKAYSRRNKLFRSLQQLGRLIKAMYPD
jgi:hypothetical protein